MSARRKPAASPTPARASYKARAARGRLPVMLSLDTIVSEELSVLAETDGKTRSSVVERLVRAETRRRARRLPAAS